MVHINQNEIDRIRSNADIVDVISHYLQVQKSGKNFKAICPFHNDHDPSLSISQDRQIYKCFVCGNGGNVFTFVQNYERISFAEAVGRVAELTGQSLSVQPGRFQRPQDPHKEALYKVLNEAINFSMYELDTVDGSAYKEYLEKRGLDQTVRAHFQIGYNPAGNALTNFLKAKGYKEKDLVNVNVSRVTESGIYDVFSNRITFPIHDSYGNPIGFSARTIEANNPSKYLNTNETDIFVKGNIVYNYHRAKSPARHEGKIYVCEGVTDVIAFWKAGIDNAVCTLGTSCTNHQIHLLKSSAARIIFCYDGDHAGQAATYRAGKMAIEDGCDISIVLNRTGKDPDEIIRESGADGLKQMLTGEISWMEFVISYFQSETNMNSFLEKKEMAKNVMQEIRQLKDQTDREYFTNQLSELTGFHFEKEVVPVDPVIETNSSKLSNVPNGLEKAETQILALMMNSPEASRMFEEQLGFLISKDAQTVAMMIVDAMHAKGQVNPASLIDQTDDENVRNLITKIASLPEYLCDFDSEKMSGAIRAVKIRLLDDEAAQYRQQLTTELNAASMELLLKKFNECLNKRRMLINGESDLDN